MVEHFERYENDNDIESSSSSSSFESMDEDFNRDDVNRMGFKAVTKQQSTIPSDNYSLAYLLIMLIGVGTILSGNVFLLAIDFFRDVYPEDSTYLEYILSFGYNAGQILGIVLLVFACPATEFESEKWLRKYRFLSVIYMSVRERIYVCLMINFVSLCVVSFVNFIIMNEYGDHDVKTRSTGKSVALWVCVAMNCVSGLGSGVLVASLFAFTAVFPWEYTQSAMGGIAVAGAAVSILRLVSKYYWSAVSFKSEFWENIAFFGFSGLFHLVCILAFFILLRLPITDYCRMRSQVKNQDVKPNAEQVSLLTEEPHDYHSIDEPKLPENSINHTVPDSDAESIASFVDPSMPQAPKKKKEKSRPWIATWTTLLSVGWGVFVTFFITFSLAPGVITDIKPGGQILSDKNWMSLLLLTCFAVSDCIGRFLPRWKRTILLNHKQLWIVILARIIFFLLIIFCVRPRFIYGDVWVCIIVISFAMTHGYCASLGMMIGPTLAKPEEAERAAVIMTLYLNLGLFVGSAFSLVLALLKL